MALSVSRDPWEPSRGKGCGCLRFQERSDWVLGEAVEFREGTRRGKRCREESRHGAQECARHDTAAGVRSQYRDAPTSSAFSSLSLPKPSKPRETEKGED